MNSSGGGGEDGSRTVVVGGTAAASGMMGMNRSPFTVLQWQELEHQALIFKYMMAGLPVPPDLVLPIQKSFESISHRFFHHPTSNLTSTLSFFFSFFLSFSLSGCCQFDWFLFVFDLILGILFTSSFPPFFFLMSFLATVFFLD